MTGLAAWAALPHADWGAFAALPIPEPGSVALLGCAMLGLAVLQRRFHIGAVLGGLMRARRP